jgi:hypothetical protein
VPNCASQPFPHHGALPDSLVYRKFKISLDPSHLTDACRRRMAHAPDCLLERNEFELSVLILATDSFRMTLRF